MRKAKILNVGNMTARLLLLHLSDIHFRKPHCLNSEMDPDRPVRTALKNDAQSLCENLGSVDAILVSGDIAFQGDPEEYDVAAEWLEELANATECDAADVFTVPGNHDVHHDTVRIDPIVRAVRLQVCHAEPDQRPNELYECILHSEAGPALMRPMQAYNMFAAKYDCAVYAPGRPFWTHDLLLNDGSALRMHGLTSTLLSGPDDSPRGLYLGPL